MLLHVLYGQQKAPDFKDPPTQGSPITVNDFRCASWAAMGTAQDTAKSEKSDFFHLSSLQYEKNRV